MLGVCCMSITNKIIDTLICEDMMSVKQTVESRKSPLDKLKEKVRKLKPEFFGYKFFNNTKYTNIKQLQWLEKTHCNILIYGCDVYRCTNNTLAIHILSSHECRYGCLLIYKCSDIESAYNSIDSRVLRRNSNLDGITKFVKGKLLSYTLVDNKTLQLISNESDVVDISIGLLFDGIQEDVVNNAIKDDIDKVDTGYFYIKYAISGSEVSVGFHVAGNLNSVIVLRTSFNGNVRYIKGSHSSDIYGYYGDTC